MTYITPQEAGRLTGLSAHALGMAALAGQIRRQLRDPSLVGRTCRWLYCREDVLAWAEERRLRAGLPPVRWTVRRCLSCDGTFRSAGPHNRLCARCGERAGRTSLPWPGWEYVDGYSCEEVGG